MAINEICESVFIHIIQNGVSLMAIIKVSCPAITGNEVILNVGGMHLINNRNQTKIMLHFWVTYPGLFFHFGFTSTSFPITIDSRTVRVANIKKSKKTSESHIKWIGEAYVAAHCSTLLFSTVWVTFCAANTFSCVGRIQIMMLDIN